MVRISSSNFDGTDVIALRLAKFMNDCSLSRCNDLFPTQKVNQQSIDCILFQPLMTQTLISLIISLLPLACSVSVSDSVHATGHSRENRLINLLTLSYARTRLIALLTILNFEDWLLFTTVC